MNDHAKTAYEIVKRAERERNWGILEHEIEAALRATAKADARVAALEAENAALREGLEFYARGTANERHRFAPEDFEPMAGSDTVMLGIEFGERARALLSAPDGWRDIDAEAKNGSKWLLAVRNVRNPEKRTISVGYWSDDHGRWFGNSISSHVEPYLYRPIPVPPPPREDTP